jgi:hypothetical protein
MDSTSNLGVDMNKDPKPDCHWLSTKLGVDRAAVKVK